MTIPNANSVVVTVLTEKVNRMMKMVVKMAMVLMMMMMSVNPGGLETIGRCLRLKVPDPSTLRPCYCYLVTVTDASLPCYLCFTATMLPANSYYIAVTMFLCYMDGEI